MKNKHRIKQCLSLLLAGGIALTNLGAALPAFAEDAPATPETAEATTPEALHPQNSLRHRTAGCPWKKSNLGCIPACRRRLPGTTSTPTVCRC